MAVEYSPFEVLSLTGGNQMGAFTFLTMFCRNKMPSTNVIAANITIAKQTTTEIDTLDSFLD